MNGTDDPRVRVLLADDHSLVRRGTREILDQSDLIVVVAEAVDGVDAVEKAKELRPDVALLDVGMPLMNGVEAAREICELIPQTRVLMLTVHDDVEYVWEAIQVGVSGYLLKDTSDADLIRSVLSVAAGRSVLDRSVTHLVLDRFRQQQLEGQDEKVPLSTRERETLALAARGMSNREIAESLDLSPRTIEVHLYNAYRKLGVSSRTGAVIAAMQRGIITLEGEL